jgi:fatty acid desaturase
VEDMPREHVDPVSITTARTSHSAEMQGRQRRYLWSMLLRTVCFVAAVATDGWLRWVFVTAAIFLPYIAVVFANAANRKPQTAEPFTPQAFGILGTRQPVAPADRG